MNTAISISQLHKHYGSLHALRGINFDIPKASFFGLLGPNGAGKSTLINIMAGLVRATQGTVRIMGHDVRRQWRQARHSLGVVPQELVVDPFFTVSEVLRLQSGYFGHGRENQAWIDELLHVLNLSDKANTNLQKLSGGMKRRVLIAQALVHKPPVVVLDEPTAGVDVELRQALWAFTKHLHQNGHTIVLTTHYLEEAEALCEQIAILNQGQLVAMDKKSALLARYPYRLLRLTLTHSEIKIPVTLQEKVQSFKNGELVLRLHRDEDQIGAILESLRTANIKFVDLHTEEPGLEEVFISLTKQKD
ncbi:MAG: ABC transporter ATP-binding protein [Gammaproteobacteria bacterium]|nr:MAG: ABC transporter ATP-binding protein [Gammaproteobacteria bacterium]RKZ36188.1 MAG: ABC transporter ATP-binding protein [Gammaproteobacteria bacterium]RKZ73162.1 MAG: ABC transporter ATP-binding protein [Gammaproteobacteria bacterium]